MWEVDLERRVAWFLGLLDSFDQTLQPDPKTSGMTSAAC
jgi:hypothetical protein